MYYIIYIYNINIDDPSHILRTSEALSEKLPIIIIQPLETTVHH